jgi:hypothetical protein
MPVASTLASSTCVFHYECKLPERADLAAHFGLVGEHVNYAKQTEAVVQMIFFSKYKIHLPDDKITDLAVVASPSYQVLKKNFYEFIKNSVDAKASIFEITVYKSHDNEIEIIVADKNGVGFRGGKHAAYFTSQDTIVNLDSLLQGAQKLPSEKQKGISLGGAGKGLFLVGESLKSLGGSLLLQATSEYSAILRLHSPKPQAQVQVQRSSANDSVSSLETDDSEKGDVFSPVEMLNKIKLASVRGNHNHFTFAHPSTSSESQNEGSPSATGSKKSSMGGLSSSLAVNSLFSPASTTEEDDSEAENSLPLESVICIIQPQQAPK